MKAKPNKKPPTKADKTDNDLAKCKSLIDILRHMSILIDKLDRNGESETTAILRQYADKITLIHNRQAVFMDALKRSLCNLRTMLDKSDAMTSVLAAYTEASVTVPPTFDEARHFNELVRAVAEHRD